MKDAVQAVLDGTDPADVLVRVRGVEAVTLAVRRNYGRPLDYLRSRSKNAISDAMFMAGDMYIADIMALSPMASNTQATIEHMQRTVELTSDEKAERRHQLDTGNYIHSKGETHAVNDPSTRILSAAFRLKRIDEKLDHVMRELLRDLLIREYSVGTIAQRWRWQPDGASTMVRYALARLVNIYEMIDTEFAAYVRKLRVLESEAKEGL